MEPSNGSGSEQRPGPEFLEVGRVLRALGLRGELKLAVWPPHTEDLTNVAILYVGDDFEPYDVEFVRPHGTAMAIKLSGCDTREQAEGLRNLIVHIHRSNATPLGPDQYYYHQIIGLQVFTVGGEPLGKVVEIIETGANDVYIVHGPSGEVLLPARAEVIKHIDLDASRLTVELLAGLLPD